MFGREYSKHLNILIQSFGEMNENYQQKVKKNIKNNTFMEEFKKLYIFLFGIPEIGFQIRSIYFKKILTSDFFVKKPKNILDAGSGIGAYSIWLTKKFDNAIITGGEIDKKKLIFSKILKKQLNLRNINFAYFDIIKPQKKALYDLIICIDVLEHIENYKIVLKNFYNILKKDGYLYIHVPQPKQKRIFTLFKKWHHEDHVREGILKKDLENSLNKLGYKIIVSRETFGFFGKLAWEINHLTLIENFVLAGILYPFLYCIAKMDIIFNNKSGLGVALLAKKITT